MSEWDALSYWGVRRQSEPDPVEYWIDGLCRCLSEQGLFPHGEPRPERDHRLTDAEFWRVEIDEDVIAARAPKTRPDVLMPGPGDLDVDITLLVTSPPAFDVFALTIDARVVHALGGPATGELLLALSRAWDLSHGRTYLGPASFAGETVWPDTWDGLMKGVGWFQYYAQAWPPTWGRAMSKKPVSDWVRLEPDGAASVVLGNDPFAWPSSPQQTLAKALGIEP